MFRTTVPIACLLAWSSVGFAADPPKAKPLPDLDDATVAAYQKAGGKYGAFKFSARHEVEFVEGKGKCDPGMTVGFVFDKTPKGDLPDAKAPFALQMAGAVVSDADVKRLKGLTSLVWLNLSHNRLGDAGVKELAALDLKALTYLSLNGTKVSKDGLKAVGTMKSLTVLHLGNLEIADADLAALTGLTNLTALELMGTPITPAGLPVVKSLPKLTEFHVDAKTIDDTGLKATREQGWLHKLPVCYAAYPQRAKADADVKEVQLSLTVVTDAGLKELSGLKSLANVGLGNEQLTDAALKTLRGQGQLLTLVAAFKDKKGMAVTKAEDVTQITLGSEKITDAALKELSAFTNVEILHLNYTVVTDKAVPDIRQFKKLTFVQLLSTKVTADGVKELKAAFPKAIVSK